jgi:hypothetical protein
MIQLGDEVKCRFTGFKGIAFGRCNYLYGCEQIMVKPSKLKDGSPIKSQWIDEPQLEVISKKNRKRPKPRHGVPTEAQPRLK